MVWIALALLGIVIGMISGLLGVGGGVLIIPTLTTFFGLTQKQAVGTSLGMMLPPIGIFAFLAYWRTGNVDVRVASTLAVAFAFGVWISSYHVARDTSDDMLRQLFAVFLLYLAGMMLFRGNSRVWAVVQSLSIAGTGALLYAGCNVLARKWAAPPHSPATLFRDRANRRPAHDFEI